MSNTLTDQEIQRLETVISNEEWNQLTIDVKAARGGVYPSDWYAKVIVQGGYLNQFQKRIGTEVGDGITITHG